MDDSSNLMAVIKVIVEDHTTSGLKEEIENKELDYANPNSEVGDATDEDETEKKEKKKGKGLSRTLKVAGTIYAYGRMISGIVISDKVQKYKMAGQNLKAERLQTTYNNVTKNVGFAVAGVAVFATANPIAIATYAFALAQQAIKISQQNQVYYNNLANEIERSNYEKQRLVKQISEVR